MWESCKCPCVRRWFYLGTLALVCYQKVTKNEIHNYEIIRSRRQRCLWSWQGSSIRNLHTLHAVRIKGSKTCLMDFSNNMGTLPAAPIYLQGQSLFLCGINISEGQFTPNYNQYTPRGLLDKCHLDLYQFQIITYEFSKYLKEKTFVVWFKVYVYQASCF